MAERPLVVVAVAGAVACCSITTLAGALAGGVALATVGRLVAGVTLGLVGVVGLAALLGHRRHGDDAGATWEPGVERGGRLS